ncbi:hypothetical protein [Spirosoma pomorum]
MKGPETYSSAEVPAPSRPLWTSPSKPKQFQQLYFVRLPHQLTGQ